MKNEVRPLRVIVKAVFLFVAINVIFALTNPPVGKITLYNNVLPGRLRFPYEQQPEFYFVGFNAPVYEDFDAMFGAHVISKNKPEGEFRLVLLGDSSTWGISVQPGDMLSEQINNLGIQTCDGRNIRAYNLGYPMPFLMRDLLILDKAMEYEPDLILWLVTLSTLEPKRAETYFILPHAERYLRLVDTYHLSSPELAQPIEEPSFYKRTLIGQRKLLKDLVFTQALGTLWAATGIDNHEGLQLETAPPSPDVESNSDYEGVSPDDTSLYFDSLMMDVVSAGQKMAGDAPVILVNEPIFVATGLNSQIRYNDVYPRWMYDEYRRFMLEWTDANNRIYLDYWDALLPDGFSDRNFHRNASGERLFADLLARELQMLVCNPSS